MDHEFEIGEYTYTVNIPGDYSNMENWQISEIGPDNKWIDNGYVVDWIISGRSKLFYGDVSKDVVKRFQMAAQKFVELLEFL